MDMGLIWQFQLFFGQKLNILVKKMDQKRQKPAPEVLDGNHGGLGRGREGKNGPDAG